MKSEMKKRLRCYAIKREDQWVAVCLDLCLAAQADTFKEAREKLHEQVVDYVEEACTVDREHAAYLLNRRAPISQWLTYYKYRCVSYIGKLLGSTRSDRKLKAFDQKMPSHPAMC